MGGTTIHTEISPAEQADRVEIRELVDVYAHCDIPNARRVVIAECGHIPHIDHPAQFLDAFLAS